MPVLNEENYLEAAVLAILSQDYAGPIQVVLALGPSTDRTNEVAARIIAGDSCVSSVQNPSGRTPEGLNAALAATTQEIVVRVDAHSELSDGYIRLAVETLQRTGADNVGGIMGAHGNRGHAFAGFQNGAPFRIGFGWRQNAQDFEVIFLQHHAIIAGAHMGGMHTARRDREAGARKSLGGLVQIPDQHNAMVNATHMLQHEALSSARHGHKPREPRRVLFR